MKSPPQITADKVLDASGLSCPIPLLKTKKALEALNPGEILKVISTDPGSREHIPVLGNRNGNSFLGMEQTNEDRVIYFIKKE